MNKNKTKKTILDIKNLKKTFGNNVILENINFSLLEGESLAIIGASGSGKSVLLKNIIGLLDPDSGSIKINSTEMVNLPRKDKENILLQLGITFQHGALFDSLRIWENIIFKVQNQQKISKVNGRKLALSIIERLSLKPEILDLFPSEISGGMQKRVAIARAIVMNPKYLFCDEPNSGLDPKTAIVIDNLIQEITKEYNITTVINSHDMNSVMEIGEKIVFLENGIKNWEGTNKEIFSTKNKSITDFVYSSELLKKVKKFLYILLDVLHLHQGLKYIYIFYSLKN